MLQHTGAFRRRQQVGLHIDVERNVVGITTLLEGSNRPLTMSLTIDNARKLQKAIAEMLPEEAPVRRGDLPIAVTVGDPEPEPPKVVKLREYKPRSRIAKTLPKEGTNKYRIYAAIKKKPGSDNDVAAILNMSVGAIRQRRGELVRSGFVRDSGERRTTAMGNEAIVWEVCE